MESFQKENVANEFSEFFGNEFLSADDFNFDSLIDFEVPECSLRFCESGENSEVLIFFITIDERIYLNVYCRLIVIALGMTMMILLSPKFLVLNNGMRVQ